MSLPTKPGYYLVLLPYFCGFYESMLSQAIDSAEEQDAENAVELESSQEYDPETYQPEHLRLTAAEYCEIYFWNTDYQATYLKVAQFWVEAFDWWCKEHLGIPEKSFAFESMVSPREYNFETDRVFAWVPEAVMNSLLRRSARYGHGHLEDCIKATFTSYDGFSSFYSNDVDFWLEKPLEEWDHNELGTLLAAVIQSSDEWDDRNAFSWALYELTFSGNGEEDEARAVDWPKVEEKVAELRAKKLEEYNTQGAAK